MTNMLGAKIKKMSAKSENIRSKKNRRAQNKWGNIEIIDALLGTYRAYNKNRWNEGAKEKKRIYSARGIR